MTTSKRTPGEWVVSQRDYGRCIVADGFFITATCLHANGGDATCNANTIALAGTVANRLDAAGYDGELAIAALPELLAKLEKWVNDMSDYTDAQYGKGELRAALARCKGVEK
jgi:hypothetical protein